MINEVIDYWNPKINGIFRKMQNIILQIAFFTLNKMVDNMVGRIRICIYTFVIGCFITLFSNNVYAQEPSPLDSKIVEMVTDRPDQTEASSVIPAKTIQYETGIVFQQENTNKNLFLYPTSLLRIGITKRFELRIINQYISEKYKFPPYTSHGFDALTVGTKIFLCKEKGLRPEISLIAHATLPVGAKAFRPQYVTPDFKFSLSNALSEKIKLGYNIGMLWEDGIKEGKLIYTCAIGYSITKRWGSFIEIYGNKALKEYPEHYLDGGFTFLARPNLQFDISAGHGITSNADDYFLSGGFSIRIPR